MNEPETLAANIGDFIQRQTHNAAEFNTLSCRLFAYQYERNAPYKRFCKGRGVSPDDVQTWRDIPPVPAVAFKHFALTCAPTENCEPEHGGRVFHSSGTTGVETSRHFMDAAALDLYRVSLRVGYQRFAPQETAGIFALMPPPGEAPHSSLSFMLDDLGADFYWGEGWMARLANVMRDQQKPHTFFGTAFAWVNFFDTINENFLLLKGCVIIETGGFKGRSREVSRDELYALFVERLGVSPVYCLAEYGMSEMASQFYDSAAYKVGPPWLKTRVFDSITGEEAAPGQPGLLAHYDLANLNSCMAIQTEDLGIAAPDGEGFTLLGRAPGAILRGCSLTAEEAMTVDRSK